MGARRRAGVDRLRAATAGTFGPASEEPLRRRLHDVIWVVGAALVIGWCVVRVQGISDLERRVFRAVNSLPDGLDPLFRFTFRLGGWWAAGLVAAAAVVGRRWRLARDLLLAGVVSAIVAVVLNRTVGEPPGAAERFQLVVRWPAGPSFPTVRLAMVVGVFSAASPYLARPTRRVLVLVATAMAVSALYLGAGYPLDVFAAAVVGAGGAAAVHLAFGSPGGRPSVAQVTASLAELGIVVRDVHLDAGQERGFTRLTGCDTGGSLWIKVIGRDEADAALIAKLWRFVVYKSSGPRLSWTRLAEVEREAYLTLLARDGGVRVPKVLVAGRAGPGAAVLVERSVAGPRLEELPVDRTSDALLADVWCQVAHLHAAHVVHGRLNAAHVVVDGQGPTLIRFDGAMVSGSSALAARDVAELLVSTTNRVGPERAVDAARRGLGDRAVGAALPWLQPAALSRETRAAAGSGPELQDRLQALRTVVARSTGREVPRLAELRRVRTSQLVFGVATVFAVTALFTQVQAPTTIWHTLRHGQPRWLGAALALSLATDVAFAVALMGTTSLRLPLWTTTELELAMSFSNLAVPVVGGMATQIRYLQRHGSDVAGAVASGGMVAAVGNVSAQALLLTVGLLLTPDHLVIGNVSPLGAVEIVLVAVASVGILAAVASVVPRVRRLLRAPAREAVAIVARVVRSPRQLAQLLGGYVGATVLNAWCLFACLRAYGTTVSLWTLLALVVAIGALSVFVPLPGGSNVVSTIGLSAALAAVGVARQVAVAAVLMDQLVVNYLPAIPGWFATRDLIRRGRL